MKLITGISVFFILLASACATVTTDIEVEAEYDPKAGFSSYRTFSWQKSSTQVKDPEGQWDPVDMDIDAVLRKLITRELEDYGLAEVDSDPDLVVAYSAGVDMTTLDLIENPENKMMILQTAPMAALAVILVDTGTGYPVWVGKATGDITDETTRGARKRRMDYAVSEMFRYLPAR